jgi:hypothetical protein
MLLKLRSTHADSNPWLEQDRLEQRKLLATALVFAGTVLAGLVWLVYALVAA